MKLLISAPGGNEGSGSRCSRCILSKRDPTIRWIGDWLGTRHVLDESASELYRPSDRRLSAKLVPTFADRRMSRGQGGGSLRPYSRLSRPEPLPFLSSSSSIVLTRLSGPRSRPTTSPDL
jgi:hypothetical protein